MSVKHSIYRPFVWLSRFRKRCGYGVHSPFAFELITCVIYVRTPYYAYARLDEESKQAAETYGHQYLSEGTKVNRLLFRLVNRVQPEHIVDAGRDTASSLYLKAAKPTASYYHVGAPSPSAMPAEGQTDFLFIHDEQQPEAVRQYFDRYAGHISPQGMTVIYGIHASQKMLSLWRSIQDDPRTGITFDLYDVGIVCFDRQKVKQHYLVNF